MFQDLAAEIPFLGPSQIVQLQITRTRPVAQVDEAALLSCNSAGSTISRIWTLKPLHGGVSTELQD